MKHLATVVLLIAVLTGCSRGHLDSPPPTELVELFNRYDVVVIGDSFTGGSLSGGQGAANWPFAVWDQLQRFDNLSVNPRVSDEGSSGYVAVGDQDRRFVDAVDAMVDRNTALVVFFGSRNDYTRDPTLVKPAAAAAFAETHRVAPQARLLVIGPLWTADDHPEPSILAVRDGVKNAALGAGGTYVDPIAERWLVDEPDLIGIDGYSPNDIGHQYLAAKIAPLVRDQLLHADPSTIH